MLPKLAENPANKIFLPVEATGIMSALSAMIEGIKSTPTVGTKA
jgi:hypothetical protein